MSKTGRTAGQALRPFRVVGRGKPAPVRPELDGHGNTDTVEILAGPDHPLSPGDYVDRYRIVRLIGMGGMARVYEATHEFTDRTVALKVMHARYSRRPDVIERFRKEAIALSRINHPNVVTIENGGLTEDGLVFIAMELLDGQTLREMLRERGRLPTLEVLSILVQVAQGVAAAHELNVIHRDLKPENIFCTKAGSVKVLDLGIAKLIGYDVKETDPNPTSTMGTAAYMAPERLEAKPAGARADIYALGVIAYECLAGHHPLAPDGDWPSLSEVAHRALAYLPPPLKNVPPALSAAVERAMHKSAPRRFDSMATFGQVLRQIRDEVTLNSAPDATRSGVGKLRLAEFMRRTPGTWAFERIRNRALVIGAAVVVLAGVGTLAYARVSTQVEPLRGSARTLAELTEVNATWFLIAAKDAKPFAPVAAPSTQEQSARPIPLAASSNAPATPLEGAIPSEAPSAPGEPTATSAPSTRSNARVTHTPKLIQTTVSFDEKPLVAKPAVETPQKVVAPHGEKPAREPASKKSKRVHILPSSGI